jgi:uncharacterized delta-60 repeat protein
MLERSHVLVFSLGTLALAACGSSSTPLGSNDGGGTDARIAHDARTADASRSDARTADAGTTDASHPRDGNHPTDAAVPDALSDVEAHDAGHASDASDAAPGCPIALDPSFGTGGVVVETTPTELQVFSVRDLLVQPDGKILVVGYSAKNTTAVVVARLDTNGSLDPTFGSGGLASFTPPGTPTLQYTEALALQSDGAIVLGGVSSPNESSYLARLTSAGVLDTTFGTQGFVTSPTVNSRVDTIFVRPDGSILMVGDLLTTGTTYVFQIAQYTTAGILDTTFGTNGVVTTPFGSTVAIPIPALLQANGDLLVAVDVSIKEDGGGTARELGFVRYTPSGALDTSFGTGGELLETVVPDGGTVYAAALAQQSTGAVIRALGGNSSFGIGRITAAGQADTTFGTGGVTTTAFSSPATPTAVAVLPGDALLLAGLVAVPADGGPNYKIGLARYSANGSLDTTFGTGGTFVTGFTADEPGPLRATALGPQGLVVAANGTTSDAGAAVLLARYACP